MDYRKAGLRKEEYEKIRSALGREPSDCELLVMGVMWSEHCCYKSSKPLLRRFPTKGEAVVQGPGENAGVVDIGDGWGAAFKVESHNHPSAVAPYQGAATGVGGIIRDILAMGARPVAAMDGLCFGDADDARTTRLARGIVAGVGGYGNAVGVPTVGGKTLFDRVYNGNPLVNAFCLGVVRLDGMAVASTARPGQKVLLLGSATGRDGIAGAAFASTELADDGKASRPQIQIGDPFEEKLLIEACLDLHEAGLIVSMQDMGAAGITSSSSEIAARSGVAIDLDLDAVPLREADMEAWEILLSESQERMLLIVLPEKVDEVLFRARRWGLSCAVIGDVTAGDRWSARKDGSVVASLPASLIGEGAPEILWPSEEPADLEARWAFGPEEMDLPSDWAAETKRLMASPNLADKRWIYESYDSMVRLGTVAGPGGPVSLLRIKENGNLLALAMETDPWKTGLDPYRGGAETVARALRALAVVGARPLGLTDCLNYASPEKPEQFWELEQSVQGMADACRALNCPVVSGNVSLYNETSQSRILPTPLVTAVGLVEGTPLRWGQWKRGDRLFLVGTIASSLAGSQYQLLRHGASRGRPLPLSFEAEASFVSKARETARSGLARSGRALAGGGLALALVREAAASGEGAIVTLSVPTRPDVLLYGEGGPRALYSVTAEKVEAFVDLWRGFPLLEIGLVGGSALHVRGLFSLSSAEIGRREGR
ncbi:phosphoribosylformylglycinamidine synthase subunit PurL [Aminithiophilus ramosus]|uniref:Phosphoribosylformylglycinamidine synthase subunit PurL n=1 Tax=Aminithiophilus ramosus TaxID=3029084 RepID=A0A9Q7AS37_9BACT|nr:phosphoribosylformylglycinamidine synthase subunit PurL [Aminithiophilus ramosus]QTX32961.1 phosphoribosylformylglycinamidine synthase subunit PurL [Aminithiophilus ramosus]